MGCDGSTGARQAFVCKFQSTQPKRAATTNTDGVIKICAFQSTQPKRAATKIKKLYNEICKFQSTQPEWAATMIKTSGPWLRQVSIHAARVGCDTLSATQYSLAYHFNPRSPNGLRHNQAPSRLVRHPISIHAARMGCDYCWMTAI